MHARRPFLAATLLVLVGCNDPNVLPPSGDASADGAVSGGACTPGSTAKDADGCNTCSCSSSGTWSCTEKACANECDPATYVSTGTCACTCNAGRIQCPPCAVLCTDGETKKADCNTCTCSDGRWDCTLIACDARDAGPDGDASHD